MNCAYYKCIAFLLELRVFKAAPLVNQVQEAPILKP